MDNNTKKQRIEQLKKGLNIGKKVAIKTGKIGAKVGKKILKKTAKATILTAVAGYHGAQKLHEEYKHLSKGAKRRLHRGLLIAGGALTIAGTVYTCRNLQKAAMPENKTDQRADSINNLLTQKYKITDEASFRKLYDDALPLIQLSMTPIEIYKSKAYDDRSGANPNTIGIGSFWYPENGDPMSSDWMSAALYFKKHPDLTVNLDKALNLVDGWFRTREKGRVYNRMFKELKGAELTLHQFAACATCTYNNEKLGFEFCGYVRDNYKNPVACAHKLTTLDPKDPDCIDGILVRHTAEACMFMYPEYAASVYSFKMKDAINSKGRPYTVTSINQTTPAECRQVKADLARGHTALLSQHKNRIMKYMCKGGYTIADLVNRGIKDEARRQELLCYMGGSTVSFEEKQADLTYEKAREDYRAGNYETALAEYQEIRARGYDGADLRCDIALVQYKLGNYQACIDECRAVLNTGEEHLYQNATYNAGRAYEAMQNYERAKINYSRSLIMAEKNNLSEDTKNSYKEAIHRMDSIIAGNQPKSQVSTQQTPKKTVSKAPAKSTKQATPKAQKGKSQAKPKAKPQNKTQSRPQNKTQSKSKGKITPQKTKRPNKGRGR